MSPAAVASRSFLIALVLLAACGSTSSRPDDLVLRQTVVVEALGQIGRPYRYGGTTPEGFDCSGLVQYVFGQAGIKLPRSSVEQRRAGREIDLKDAEAGDLLFYRIDHDTHHVAIYLGDGRAVHAPARGRSVIVAPIGAEYWKKRFLKAVRVLD